MRNFQVLREVLPVPVTVIGCHSLPPTSGEREKWSSSIDYLEGLYVCWLICRVHKQHARWTCMIVRLDFFFPDLSYSVECVKQR